MKKKYFFIIITVAITTLLLMTSIFSGCSDKGETKTDKYKVVFHVDYIDGIDLVLGNIQNLLADLGESNVEVELVVNYEAITMLSKPSNKYTTKILDLASKGVIFAACANSMKGHNLTKEDMLEVVIIVPSGVGELTKKQAQGWAYIRP